MEAVSKSVKSEKPFIGDEPEQCIICGTFLDDLDPEEIVTIEQGRLCRGCFNEGWFKQCSVCGRYEFEDSILYLEDRDVYFCERCYRAEESDDG